MREIIFRGRRIDSNTWVEGYIYADADEKAYIIRRTRYYPDTRDWDTAEYYENNPHYTESYIEINPNTVGQYTGLKDKNGKMIFEGDIVHYDTLGPYSGPEYYIPHVGPVIFSDLCCFLPLTYCVRDTLEVVGNIYDNPEMCKEV